MGIAIDFKNNARVLFDNTKAAPAWIDAYGADVVKKIIGPGVPTDDTTGDPTEYTMTVTEAGAGNSTVVNSVTAGEVLTLTTAANEYDGINLQLKGEPFKLETSKPLYFEAKLKIDDVTQSDILIGICETDTTLLATAAAHAVAVSGDGAFFVKLDATTTLSAKAYLDGAETATADYGTALVDDTAFTVSIYWDGVNLSFYVDDSLVQTISGSLPDGDMTFSINVRAGSAAARTATLYPSRVIQLRG